MKNPGKIYWIIAILIYAISMSSKAQEIAATRKQAEISTDEDKRKERERRIREQNAKEDAEKKVSKKSRHKRKDFFLRPRNNGGEGEPKERKKRKKAVHKGLI